VLLTCDHNTFLHDSTGGTLEVSESCVFTNNVFRGVDYPWLFLMLSRDPPIPDFRYNCLWGYEKFGGTFDGEIALPDSITNVVADPMLLFKNDLISLEDNSPCIDEGDPDAPHDPDGTRSDIGAHYYHQNDEVQLEGAFPSAFGLTAFPNPFNSMLTIRYATGGFETAPTRVGIYDVNGREVAYLLGSTGVSAGQGFHPAAEGGATANKATWDATGSPAGVYLIKTQHNGEVTSKSVMLVK